MNTAVAKVEHPDTASGILAVIERAALNPDVDVDKMQKLLDMQLQIMDKQAKINFNSALAAMQQDLPEITENGAISVNGDVRSRYATFEDINDAIKPVLQRHGFAITFRIKQVAPTIEITAVLSHREGHSEETSMTLPSDTSGSKNTVQAMGSAVSYGKRYTMMALLNITSRAPEDKDDDAGATSDFITTVQAVDIDVLIGETKADKPKFLKYMGVDSVRQILTKDYTKAMNALNAKKAKGAA